jgi:hypothetical protein
MHLHMLTQIIVICKLAYKIKQTLFPELVLPAPKKLNDDSPPIWGEP